MKIIPSPNFDQRPTGGEIDILLLHYTGMKSADEALERLIDPDARVSAHYLVDEQGGIFQLVDETDRAWHAGVAHWQGGTDINSCSIGIEIVNPGHEFGYRPFGDRQMAAVIDLGLEIAGRHSIPTSRVIGHSDVAPQRKQDPGELFPWQDLAQAGLGAWFADDYRISENAPELAPGMSGAEVVDLQLGLSAIGYQTPGTGLYETETEAVVTAFQRHWRQHRVDGIADKETCSAIYHIHERMRERDT